MRSRAVWAATLLIVGAVVVTYWNSLRVPFFFDDPAAITKNPTIRHLSDLGAVLSPPRSGTGVTGRPVVNLSLAINYALSGAAPAGYHFTNLLLHAFAGLALFGIVHRTLRLPLMRGKFEHAAVPVALGSALVWTLHPLQTESVTCVIQRTEVLVGLFYLLTLYLVARAIGEPTRKRWPLLATLACFIGMASKEVMVSAPLIVLLYDRSFAAGSFAEAWRQRRGLYLGLAASWLLLGWLVIGMGGTRGEVAGFGVGQTTWWAYALKQCEAILLYLRLAVWPHPLVVFYGIDVVNNPVEVWPEIVVLSALVAAVVVALWRAPRLGFVGMWFFAILAPSSSVVPLLSQTVAEHRMYLPLAAPVVTALASIYLVMPRRFIGWTAAVAVALALVSVARNRDYRSELSIWQDTVAKMPRNARARINFATTLQTLGRHDEALQEFQRALADVPNQPEALNNLATLLIEHHRPAEAIEPCRVALRVNPKFAEAHSNLGNALAQVGQLAEAVQHLETAIALDPELGEAHCNYAGALIELGRLPEAVAEAQTAARLSPRLALAHFYLALAYLRQNDAEHARPALEAALAINPNYAEAYLNLGTISYQAGDIGKAVAYYESAVRVGPDLADAHANLASALLRAGNLPAAIEHYRAALQRQPNNAEIYFNLGLAFAQAGKRDEAIAAFSESARLRPGDPRAKNAVEQLRANPGPKAGAP